MRNIWEGEIKEGSQGGGNLEEESGRRDQGGGPGASRGIQGLWDHKSSTTLERNAKSSQKC